ncbi:MAG: hypothetical protein ABW092_15815 [Candidatus Thiodiazotropha sp.]
MNTQQANPQVEDIIKSVRPKKILASDGGGAILCTKIDTYVMLLDNDFRTASMKWNQNHGS